MKKICLILLAFIIFTIPCVYADSDVNITVNRQKVLFIDTQPFIENDRTLVPIRALAENMGFTVGWDDLTKTVTVTIKVK